MKEHILFSFISSLVFAVQATQAAAQREENLNNQLRDAAYHGEAQRVQEFIDAGAHVNAQTHTKITALMWAASFGYADIVQALLAAGADPTIVNNEGKTALDLAKTDEISTILTMPTIKAAGKE